MGLMKLINKIGVLIFTIVLITGWGLEVRNVGANVLPPKVPQYYLLDGNNISSYIWDSGVIDQNPTLNNSPGFEWPKGSQKNAMFSAGLTVMAYVNGEIRMAANSYQGELMPGSIINGTPTTGPNFRIYKINDWDNCQSNLDYAQWGMMVPYGAPYIDINNNGQYDDCLDKPGIFNARQTIFVAMTDGFPETHNSSEGFGGGTSPLFADYRLTAWCYNIEGLKDVQFLKWNIINQHPNNNWDSTFFSIISDPDLGDATDDYIGTDTTLDFAFSYNADSLDGPVTWQYGYGAFPPAVGFLLLRSPLLGQNELGMTSSAHFTNTGSTSVVCERDPYNPQEAYNLVKGLKKDGTPWLNPEFNPPVITKYTYPGDPETGTGWTEFTGKINNCGGAITGSVIPSPGGDRRIIVNSGSKQLTIGQSDTTEIVIAQLISQGSNNLNSVTKLKEDAARYKNLYDNGFDFSVSGTVRYIDNGNIVTSGYVKALRIDGNTGNVLVMDSTGINTNGTYTLTKVPVGEIDIMAYPSSELENFVPTYFPNTTMWQNAATLTPDSNMTGINISVIRTAQTNLPPIKASINGRIGRDSISNSLKDAVVYLKQGDNYYTFDISNDSGKYQIETPGIGVYKVFINRLGFSSDSQTVNIQNPNATYDLNFILTQQYVGITNNSNIIPGGYNLSQNYPNPFNPATRIKFQLPESNNVKLVIYDITGRQIAILVNEKLTAGEYIYEYNAGNLSSGIYYYSLITENFSQTKKMVLIK